MAESQMTGPVVTAGDALAPLTDLHYDPADHEHDVELDGDVKPKKRHFWQVNKKREDKARQEKALPPPATIMTPPSEKSNVSNGLNQDGITTPIATEFPLYNTAAAESHSPSQLSTPLTPTMTGGTTSHLTSPASSLIFERSVQDDGFAATVASPAIPSHITTENHIPPVLDAASYSITDQQLSPDQVEIVTHQDHMPAALSVAAATSSVQPTTPSDIATPSAPAPQLDASVSSLSPAEDVPSYASLDATDPRRLSFISFADVVHAEHVHHPGSVPSSAPGSGLASPVAGVAPTSGSILSNTPGGLRAASPGPRSILGSVLESSGSMTAPLTSAPRKLSNATQLSSSGLLSPNTVSTAAGDLKVETLTQALRRSGSGDLASMRDQQGLASPAGHSSLNHSQE